MVNNNLVSIVKMVTISIDNKISYDKLIINEDDYNASTSVLLAVIDSTTKPARRVA